VARQASHKGHQDSISLLHNDWSRRNEQALRSDFLGDSNYLDDGSSIGSPFQKRFQLSMEVKVRVCIRSR